MKMEKVLRSALLLLLAAALCLSMRLEKPKK